MESFFRRTEHLRPVDLPVAFVADRVTRAHLFENRIHDVRAMTRARQPASHYLLRRSLAGRDVFADSLPFIRLTIGAIAGFGATGRDMAEIVLFCHIAAGASAAAASCAFQFNAGAALKCSSPHDLGLNRASHQLRLLAFPRTSNLHIGRQQRPRKQDAPRVAFARDADSVDKA